MGVIEELNEEEETKDEENGVEATKDNLEDKKEEMKKEAVDECGSTTDKDDKDNSSTHSCSGPLFNSECYSYCTCIVYRLTIIKLFTLL